ncbi:UNVERIFIED_CONTAM: hypothetical protein FKN15_000573 [Acipenser sinensis]
MAVVCDPNLKDTCNKTCVPGAQRSAHSVDRYSQIRGYVSAGPVQLVPEGQVLDLKTSGGLLLQSLKGVLAGGSNPSSATDSLCVTVNKSLHFLVLRPSDEMPNKRVPTGSDSTAVVMQSSHPLSKSLWQSVC